jgi:nicotinate phosphoribosyltransferase
MKSTERRAVEGILFTDQYQLTMAQLYFRTGIHERRAQFDHFFRHYPDFGLHMAGYCINAGLEWLMDWMRESWFRDEDIEYLKSQRNSSGGRIFGDDFLGWLKKGGNFDSMTVSAIPEGRVVHPNVPLTVVRGHLAMAQVLETSLLNHLNYQTLIATRAARVHDSGGGRPLIEFGMRRAHDKGANAGARAALIGGADFTSNVGISKVLGYPPKGTHAHSMVQAFMALGEGELGAFRAYAEVYPDDCILLVDTINTLESGIPNAIKVFEELKKKGHRPAGVRLDSGDLAYLAIQAAKMLNEAGFSDTSIVLSNELDELVIWQIITQIKDEAPRYGLDADHLIGRLVFGVGTKLITSQGKSSLGGVYKLVAINDGDKWAPAIKLSESPEKTINPGFKSVRRIYDKRNKATADLICKEGEEPEKMKEIILRHPVQRAKSRTLRMDDDISGIEPLLIEIMKEGKLVRELPSIEDIRKIRRSDVERLDPGIKRLVNPHIYHVSLSQQLWELKQALISSVIRG